MHRHLTHSSICMVNSMCGIMNFVLWGGKTICFKKNIINYPRQMFAYTSILACNAQVNKSVMLL